jgi:hypothetical protein
MKAVPSHSPATRDPGAADVLVSAEWLEAHLLDPAVRVVEVDVSRRAYDEWTRALCATLASKVGRSPAEPPAPSRPASGPAAPGIAAPFALWLTTRI